MDMITKEPIENKKSMVFFVTLVIQWSFVPPFFFVSFRHASHRGEFCSPFFSLSMIVTTAIKGNEAPPNFFDLFCHNSHYRE
jgi:hypothetical protein